MNKEEIVCTALDNTVRKSDEKLVENATCSLLVAEDILTVGDNVEDSKHENAESVLDLTNVSNHDENEDEADVMTGSYIEISFDQDVSEIKNDALPLTRGSSSKELGTTEGEDQDVDSNDTNSSKEKKRPNSLVLVKNSRSFIPQANSDGKCDPVTESEGTWTHVHRSQQTSDSQATSIEDSPSMSSEEFALYSSGHHRTGSDTSGLSELQGTLTVDGDMVSFVADDLQEKIKMSSPVSRWTDSSSFPGSRSSTPSLYRQALQPHIPVIDAGAVADLEVHARKVATCVDTMLENLSGTLQSISSLTVDYMETFEKAVCKTCDSVDLNIKAMYQLMAKYEELSNSMQPLYKVSKDIKEIKRVLDHLEHAVENKS